MAENFAGHATPRLSNLLYRHPERSEGSTSPIVTPAAWILRCAQDDGQEEWDETMGSTDGPQKRHRQIPPNIPKPREIPADELV
jgi:hypothetical protein